MTSDSLFPELDAVVADHERRQQEEADHLASLSADQRRTLRQANDIAEGRHPLTGGPLHPLASRHRDAVSPKTDPFTCGSCHWRGLLGYHGKRYPKCVNPGDMGADEFEQHGPRAVTHSASTDVRAWWPACRDYTPGEPSLSPDAARHIPEASR